MTATGNSSLTVTLPSDTEILMTRTFDAPRELVFEAMTRPEHVKRWWGPRNSVLTACEIDFRPGGRWHYTLDCDGKKVKFWGEFHEIVPPEKLVCTECYDEPRVGSPKWNTTMTLADIGGGRTRVTSRVAHPSKEARDGHLGAGMERGATETYERLAELLDAQGANTMEREIEIKRIFDAPPDLVYRAWTVPEHLTQWWGPRVFTNHDCKLDVRSGGAWQIVMRSPDGMDHRCTGVYSEVVPNERLVFTNNAEDRNGKPLLKGFTTVLFAAQDGKTELTLRTRAVGLVDYAPQMLAGMHAGWSQSLDKLGEHVARR